MSMTDWVVLMLVVGILMLPYILAAAVAVWYVLTAKPRDYGLEKFEKDKPGR